MKKTLLTLACAAIMGSTANAQVCEMYNEPNYHKLSEDGVWLVENNNGTLRIYNRVTKQERFFNEMAQDYVVGIGNSVLNDGTVCLAVKGGAAILKDSVMLLETDSSNPDEVYTMSITHGATNDGNRLVGVLDAPNASFGSEDLMAFPVMWEKNAEGEYKLKHLPYPTKDFTGRSPQYVTAIDIADDGKTVVGQIQDHTGFYTSPIVWKEDAEGNWTFSTPAADYIYDASKIDQLPEPPVEPEEPIAENYMSKDDSVAYVNAVALYQELLALAQMGAVPWDSVPEYPEKGNYISDSLRAEAYAEAMMKYDLDNEKYWQDFENFDAILQEITTGAMFAFNNAGVSRNGKYMVTSLQKLDENGSPNPWFASYLTIPCRFDLTKEKITVEEVAGLNDHLGSSVANNGLLVAVSPAMEYTRTAYVSMPGEAAMPFIDYLAAEKQDSVVKFLKDNFTYTFNVEVGVDSMGMPIYGQINDSTITGTLTVNGEGNRFVSFIYDQMTNPENAIYVSFFIELAKNDDPAAIENALREENNGEVISREYYNLQGQRIAQPAKGIYLEKVTTTNGVYTKKVLK